MQLLLSKNVEGINRETNETRLHGKAGDVLFVLLTSTSYYVCDSKYYPNQTAIVFRNQVERLIKEDDISDSEEQAISDEFTLSGDHLIKDFRDIIEEEGLSIRHRDEWSTSSDS